MNFVWDSLMNRKFKWTAFIWKRNLLYQYKYLCHFWSNYCILTE